MFYVLMAHKVFGILSFNYSYYLGGGWSNYWTSRKRKYIKLIFLCSLCKQDKKNTNPWLIYICQYQMDAAVCDNRYKLGPFHISKFTNSGRMLLSASEQNEISFLRVWYFWSMLLLAKEQKNKSHVCNFKCVLFFCQRKDFFILILLLSVS